MLSSTVKALRPGLVVCPFPHSYRPPHFSPNGNRLGVWRCTHESGFVSSGKHTPRQHHGDYSEAAAATAAEQPEGLLRRSYCECCGDATAMLLRRCVTATAAALRHCGDCEPALLDCDCCDISTVRFPPQYRHNVDSKNLGTTRGLMEAVCTFSFLIQSSPLTHTPHPVALRAAPGWGV